MASGIYFELAANFDKKMYLYLVVLIKLFIASVYSSYIVFEEVQKRANIVDFEKCNAAYFISNIDLDGAENEPKQVCSMSMSRI